MAMRHLYVFIVVSLVAGLIFSVQQAKHISHGILAKYGIGSTNSTVINVQDCPKINDKVPATTIPNPYIMSSERPEEKSVLRKGKEVTLEENMAARSVIAHLIGGLGNNMWIYASLWGIGKKTGRQAISCNFRKMQEVFGNLSMPFYTIKECQDAREKLRKDEELVHWQKEHHFFYDTSMISQLRDSPIKNSFVCCYLQNTAFFIEYLDEIRTEFTIRQKLKVAADYYLRSIAERTASRANRTLTMDSKGHLQLDGKPTVFVAIHVRRGDMLKEKDIQVPPASYFEQAMRHFRAKYGDSVIFYVATNDVKWCQENIGGDDVFIAGAHRPQHWALDFAVGASCNHTIMSVGTFGWWIGFLTGGEVIYYKDFLVKESRWTDFYYNWQLFPYTWIGL